MSVRDTDTSTMQEIRRFLETLYPDAPDDAFLVLSYPVPTKDKPKADWPWKSQWFRRHQEASEQAIQTALQLTYDYDVYYGVCLRHPTCTPSPYTRGKDSQVYVVPGLWGDWDVASGDHKQAEHLPPTVDDLLAFFATLPSPPSLILHSGGGLHTYHLFREPWLIQEHQDRQAITTLLERFQYTIRTWAREHHGWDLTILADLPRVLRLPGTINHKYGTAVDVLHEESYRYKLSDFEPWVLDLPDPATAPSDHHGIGTGQLDLAALAQHYGVKLTKKSAQELVGAHPVHGSSTGSNLNINPAKQLWRCWRCLTGGDALYFVAMCEGLLRCDDVRHGALTGDLFKHVVAITNEKFKAEIRLDAQQRRNGSTPGPEPPDPYACPALPAYAKTDDQWAAGASLFLDDYIAFSQKWAPRAYEGFHEAVALFVLATIAARRIKIELGPRGVYTSLYMALTARTTIFTKTTVAEIGLALLDAAGLSWLLADDDATPQAFLRSLSLYVPSN